MPKKKLVEDIEKEDSVNITFSLSKLKEAIEEIDTSKPSKKLREDIIVVKKMLTEKYLEVQKILLRR